MTRIIRLRTFSLAQRKAGFPFLVSPHKRQMLCGKLRVIVACAERLSVLSCADSCINIEPAMAVEKAINCGNFSSPSFLIGQQRLRRNRKKSQKKFSMKKYHKFSFRASKMFCYSCSASFTASQHCNKSFLRL